MKRFYLAALIGLGLSATPAQAAVGHFIMCNGCSLPMMRTMAANYGEGEHLVIDVFGRKGRRALVACGSYRPSEGKPEDTKADLTKAPEQTEFVQSCRTFELSWTPADQAAFDFIIDGMNNYGAWSKELTIDYPYSIYDLAPNREANFGPIVDSLWGRLYTYQPGSSVWGTLVQWGANFLGMASDANLRVTIQFPDGYVHADIDMSWIEQGFDGPSTSHVEILYESARDSDNNFVPGLSMPAQINPPGVQFNFFGAGGAPDGWREMMSNAGYGFGSSASGGRIWRCGLASGNGTAGYTCILIVH